MAPPPVPVAHRQIANTAWSVDWVVESFRARAQHAGRSLEEELRQFLTEAARERRRRFIAELDELNARLREKYGKLPDSTPLIREERNQ